MPTPFPGFWAPDHIGLNGGKVFWGPLCLLHSLLPVCLAIHHITDTSSSTPSLLFFLKLPRWPFFIALERKTTIIVVCSFVQCLQSPRIWNESSTPGTMGPPHSSAPPTFVQCRCGCTIAPHQNRPQLLLSADLSSSHRTLTDTQVFFFPSHKPSDVQAHPTLPLPMAHPLLTLSFRYLVLNSTLPDIAMVHCHGKQEVGSLLATHFPLFR